jgi:hypothetical protein
MLRQYKTTQIQVNEEGNNKTPHFYKWFFRAVHDGVLNPKRASSTNDKLDFNS